MLKEPLGEFLLDLQNRLSFLASRFGRRAFAFLLLALRLLLRLLLLVRQVFNLLPPSDLSQRAQRGDDQDRHGDQPPPQPAAVDVHFLVDLLDLIGKPLDLELQAADLLIELLD